MNKFKKQERKLKTALLRLELEIVRCRLIKEYAPFGMMGLAIGIGFLVGFGPAGSIVFGASVWAIMNGGSPQE